MFCVNELYLHNQTLAFSFRSHLVCNCTNSPIGVGVYEYEQCYSADLYSLRGKSTHCFQPQRTASPPVGAVLDGLGVDLTAAHVFDTQRQPLSIPDLGLSHGLQVGLLHLGVASPHDLPAGVHGHGRLLPTQLRQRGRGKRRVRCKIRKKEKKGVQRNAGMGYCW